MSVFNGTFTNTVKKQITIRQVAKTEDAPKNNALLIYNHAKTAFVRLTSSVDTTVKTSAGEAFTNNTAKLYTLEGGALYPNGSNVALRAGIGKANPKSDHPVGGAYGDLGGLTLGLRPMPGITSLKVENKGFMGSLRLATITYQCWTMEQLNALEKLYMRTGYSALVEWGTSQYLDHNSKQLVSNKYRIDIVNDNRASYESILQSIDESREKSCGNYDAMFGYVQQFNWKDNPAGGFDCTCQIISMGTILESMKLNYTASASTSVSGGVSTFYFGQMRGEKQRKDLELMYNKGKIIGLLRELLSPNYLSAHYTLNDTGKYYYNQIHQVRHIHFKQNDYIDARTNEINASKLGTYYIPFETIIELINEYVLLRNTKGGKVISKLSTKHKNGENIKCVSNKLQTSVNAYICVVMDKVSQHSIKYNVDGTEREIIIKRPNLKGGKVANPLKYYYDDSYNTANIGHIYISIEYFLNVIQKNTKPENNTVDVYSAIKYLLNPLQQALGGLNKFDIFIDPDDNVGRIVDYNYIEENKTKSSKYTLKTTGLGSIVRSRTMESTIFPSAATMIAIAARGYNTDNTMGLDVDSMIHFNQGLRDRIFPAKITPDNDKTLKTEQQKSPVTKIEEVISDLNRYSELLSSNLEDKNDSEMQRLMSSLIYGLNTTLTVIKKADLSKSKKINNFIIPINLQLTIDGIAGINIGEVFTLPANELPESYSKTNIGFIVTGVSHDVQNNDWTTTISTQSCVLE